MRFELFAPSSTVTTVNRRSKTTSEGAQGGNSNEGHEEPIRKVATNFSTVDYDQEITQQRRNTEYAPHETVKTPNQQETAARTPTTAEAVAGAVAKTAAT
ncbi:hypothetical protein DV738_g5305, partial [Chaetothyriales sp. CBS 135597]